MDFSKNNCNLFYKFYTYVLAKYYGIGEKVITDKDRLLAYLNINWQYLEIPSDGTTIANTIFVGQVVSSTTIIEPDKVSKFYQNDQDAYNNGVGKDEIYYLSLDNTYGLPYGTPKKLVEDVT